MQVLGYNAKSNHPLPRLLCLVPFLYISQGKWFHNLNQLWIMCSVADKK